jgi:hypothetical protein
MQLPDFSLHAPCGVHFFTQAFLNDLSQQRQIAVRHQGLSDQRE